jgi:ribosomal-protein-alanine N-acetyltransferase
MPALDTPRLRLDPLSPSHADALYSIYCEPEVRRFLITCPSTRAEFAHVFDRTLRFGETHGVWAIVDPISAATIGRIGFFTFGELARPEIAFLLSRTCWGRGLATEAAVAAMTYGFAHHDWVEVVGIVRTANVPAIRVLAKLGMQPEGEIEFGSGPAVVQRVTDDAFRRHHAFPS